MPDDQITATCTCVGGNAALFTEPNSSSAQVGVYVEQGEEVIVLGKATTGSWIFVEFQGEKGWVDASRFDIEVELTTLPFATPDYPTWTPGGSPSITTTPLSPTSAIAYWNEGVKSPTQNGEWQVTLSLRVPQGGSYTFSMGELDVKSNFVRDIENNYALYNVTISGMSCTGPLIGDLIVQRNGQTLVVQNEHNSNLTQIFVSAADC